MNCNVRLYYSVTVLLQGQFKVETTTLFQPHFNRNVVSTVKSQRQSNLQIQVTTIFQPCFNVDM